MRNHTDRNLPFSLHRFHVSQGASTPLTGYHFLREDFWNLQIRPGPPSPPLNHLNSNQAYNFLSQHQTHFSFGAALGLGCYLQAFSSCDEQGLLSSCHVQASHWSGFSCCRVQTRGHMDAVVVATGLVAHDMLDLSSWPSHLPCIGRWILNHWMTRDNPS